MKHALVTGAYGFVGRHLSRRLAAQGVHVVGLGHGAWGRQEWREWGIAEWHQADVNLETLITYAGFPDSVFHCAGSGSVPFSIAHPFQDYGRTVSTTLAVLEFMRTQTPHATLVLPSSAGVYGIVRDLPIKTSARRKPVSPYGFHKKLSEDLCRSYGDHFGVKSAVVRLFSVYGNGLRKQLLWDASRKLAKGQLEFSGTGFETRDWLHIEDAASLLITAAGQATASCPVANGGTGKSVAIREIVGLLAEEMAVKMPVSFTGSSRPGDPNHYEADIHEASAWGWEPQRHWAEQVRAYARWFQEQGQ